MISFKQEWAQGMDGEHLVKNNVSDLMKNNVSGITDPVAVSGSIDHVLATVCSDSNGPTEAVEHLNYIIKELTKARDNIQKTTTEG